MKRKLVDLVFLMLFLFGPICAQKKTSLTYQVYFPAQQSKLESITNTEKDSLNQFLSFLKEFQQDRTKQIKRVQIKGFCSPEGSYSVNRLLACQRALSMMDVLQDVIHLSPAYFEVTEIGIPWPILRNLVSARDFPQRQTVYNLIACQDPNESTQAMNHSIWMIDGGKTSYFLNDSIYPFLRKATVDILFTDENDHSQMLFSQQELASFNLPPTSDYWNYLHSSFLQEGFSDCLCLPEAHFLFALKTNLLYDVALSPNIEIEIALGKRWSINGEYLRGWWLRKNTFCWQLQTWGAEGRYWFKEFESEQPLNGWFMGLFVLGGIYDFQFQKTKGKQGDFLFFTGLSGGYTHRINKWLQMEYALGVGYFRTNYYNYRVVDNQYLVKDGTKRRFSSIFPAKAKVSLVWLLQTGNKKGGRYEK